jgi:hypothetical protein
MAFSGAEKVSIRRYCGFQAFGGQPVQAFGHRFYTHYGTLEFRISNLSSEEEGVVRSTFLANLATLETDIIGAAGVRSNLDTDQAAVWTHNKHEYRDRKALFDGTRRELCKFLGVPPGPGLAAEGMSFVV